MTETEPFEGQLLTARLSLRRPAKGDIHAILAIHSDPATCLHNPSDVVLRRADAEQLYQRWDDQWERYGYGYWVVRRHDSARQLGFCGIKPMELKGIDILNLFYRFDRSAWGQGLASEAATAVTRWAARSVPGLPLVARIRPANVASQRVAVHAGLSRAAHLDGPGFDGFDWVFAVEPHPCPLPG
ncbi:MULTISPECIES: GNAT family N-acetyltransferase [Streptomyces]|uniref:GNAT family N-acetyltransferase n=2 Tax=Streptomyces TaxID=1883 RepID=A0A646KNF8_STRJU|nr:MULTISPECIES: GNAT family N-acetyltransferase [Streptomyces]MQS38858.1 GNAT family N-acetyltransferase [Streptomyces katsurahamanus]MQT03775.1 GNAT family N-acetyltransferase [Streptomyces jumonjinensis]